jgi:hypothetical protein
MEISNDEESYASMRTWPGASSSGWDERSVWESSEGVEVEVEVDDEEVDDEEVEVDENGDALVPRFESAVLAEAAPASSRLAGEPLLILLLLPARCRRQRSIAGAAFGEEAENEFRFQMI